MQVIQKPGQDGQALLTLHSPLTQEGVSDLLDRSVDRLLEVDSPSLETMKMQVAVDSSYIAEEEDLINFYQRRSSRLRDMQRTIATMRPKDGADFDALTALHRQVRAPSIFSRGNADRVYLQFLPRSTPRSCTFLCQGAVQVPVITDSVMQ